MGDYDEFYDTSESESDDVGVSDESFFSVTSGATHIPGGNDVALTVAQTVATQSRAGPETAAVDGSQVVKPPDKQDDVTNLSNVINNPVVRIKDSSFGHSQDYIYDNLDQYAWHELEPSTLDCPVLDSNRIFELEKWVQDMPIRKLKALARARAKEEDWSHWQRFLAWFPLKVIKKTRDATTNYAYTAYDNGNMKRHKKSQNPVNPKNRLNESFATDTFFAEEKALGGATCAQIFWGPIP